MANRIPSATVSSRRHRSSRPARGAFVRSTVLGAALVVSGLVAPAASAGPEDEPNNGEMIVDAVIARPIGLATTVFGTAAFLVTLPFSAMGGNIDQAADKLVIDPARETFVRCLGCRQAGHPDRFRGKEGEIQ